MKSQPEQTIKPEVDEPEHLQQTPAKRRGWLWALVILVAVGGTVWRLRQTEVAAPPPASKKGPAVTAVVAEKARKGRIGVYLNGLGSVTPIYTVTVKSRVDGQLMRVLYNEGDLVHQDDLLMEIDPRPFQVQLEQAQAQLARDQATLANANIDLKRYESLMPKQAIPEQTVATQKALVAQTEAAIQGDQAQIDSAKLSLTYCRITAPITGKAGLRLVDPGNIVHAADTNGLVVITQMQPISVIFTLGEDQLALVRKRMKNGALNVDLFDRAMQNQLAHGTLSTLDNQIDPSTGTLRLRATFSNTDESLFPNQFVNVRLLVEQHANVTLIPSAAVQRNAQGTTVYLITPQSTVSVRQVMLGANEGDVYEVTSGLSAGDAVVVAGTDRLQEGGKVNPHFNDEPRKTGKKP